MFWRQTEVVLTERIDRLRTDLGGDGDDWA